MKKILDIKLGFQCNNNCVFCLNKDKKQFKSIPLKNLKEKVASFASEAGDKKLVVSGGEPIISENFFKILSFAKERGIDTFEIQTNGRMLAYEKLVKKIKKFESVGFLVSLHFPNQKLYKKYCQAEGFDQVIRGLKNLTKHNLNPTVNTVVMKPTLQHLENIIKILKKIGIKKTQYRYIDGSNVMHRYKEFVPRYSESVPEVKKIIKKHSNDIKIALREFPICALGEKYKDYLAPPVNPKRKDLTTQNELKGSKEVHSDQFSFPCFCEDCQLRSRCRGIRKEYIQKYNTKEFKPIT